MEFKVNINDYVKVKLTDRGKTELENQREDLNRFLKERGGKGLSAGGYNVDEQGYTSFQLWDLMSRFGHLMSLGMAIPFETTVIVTRGEQIDDGRQASKATE